MFILIHILVCIHHTVLVRIRPYSTKSFNCFEIFLFKPSTLKFFFIKILSLIFVFFVFWVIIFKSKIIQDINNFESFLMAAICVFIFLTPFFLRSIVIRPFCFWYYFHNIVHSGIRILERICLCIYFNILYPYLSWFYILPVAFCHFFKGSKKFCFGVLTVLFAFFSLSRAVFLEATAGDLYLRKYS